MRKRIPQVVKFNGGVYRLAVTRDWLEAFKQLTDEQVKAMSPEELQKTLDDTLSDMIDVIYKAKLAEEVLDRIKKLQLGPIMTKADGTLDESILQFRNAVAKIGTSTTKNPWEVIKKLQAESPELKQRIDDMMQASEKVNVTLAKHSLEDQPKSWLSKPHRTITESSSKRTALQAVKVPVEVVEYLTAMSSLAGKLDSLTSFINASL